MKRHHNYKFLKKVALILKNLREEKGLTQEDFYNDTGINIGRVERGINDISVSTLIRICEYFEITPEEFFRRCR